jgi:hypothetical protein
MFVRHRTQPALSGLHRSYCSHFVAMHRNKYRLKLETDPPSSSSAAQDAHWLMLGDLVLDPVRRSKLERGAPSTRAHQEHELLKEELREALDKYADGLGAEDRTRICGNGYYSSRAHAAPRGKAPAPQHRSDGREPPRKTQSPRIRASGR